MTTSLRIASWIYRDLSLRGGFREVTDLVGPSGGNMIVDYWAKRIEEEIGDNRLIKALEQIRDEDYRGNRPESAFIAMRALGPAREAEAAVAGVTTLATDGKAVQLDMGCSLTKAPDELPRWPAEQLEALAKGELKIAEIFAAAEEILLPTPNAESVTAAIDAMTDKAVAAAFKPIASCYLPIDLDDFS